ncbi:hypothetical protein EIJ04_17950 [Xanthomonas perforans]|nr:hypothetical protein EI541_22060 [Xanthomonas axonopodis pv. eucalyptorum]TQS97583.1 hypothetical protein EIJ44_20465 [Xanthomonas perforans]TQT10458.1 hypothetical protein EIJ11_22335 [Xanthomonas perforans]TQT13951.1 hypothetical protein EIJ05_17960 [Xanthomonas perforans]TQT26104.1 hypothetical protein EIJ04_17950 [Xanthomonas perforans]
MIDVSKPCSLAIEAKGANRGFTNAMRTDTEVLTTSTMKRFGQAQHGLPVKAGHKIFLNLGAASYCDAPMAHAAGHLQWTGLEKP